MHKAYLEYIKKIFTNYCIKYWKIVKGEKTSEMNSKISIDILKEHFEKLALGNESVDVSDTSGISGD